MKAAWVADNLGTIVITLVLILIVAAVITLMVKKKKQGTYTCGGNCTHCKMCAGCRPVEKSRS